MRSRDLPRYRLALRTTASFGCGDPPACFNESVPLGQRFATFPNCITQRLSPFHPMFFGNIGTRGGLKGDKIRSTDQESNNLVWAVSS